MTIEEYDKIILERVSEEEISFQALKSKILKDPKSKNFEYFKNYLRFRTIIKALNSVGHIDDESWEKLENLSKILDLELPERLTKTFESIVKREEEPFSIYLTRGLAKARLLLGLDECYNKNEELLSFESTFSKLNLQKEIDLDCNEGSTFYIGEDLLPPHSTPICLSRKLSNYLDFFKVFRRQNIDRTHLCEFYQIEFNKGYSGKNPIKQLIRIVLIILESLELNPKLIKYKYTNNAYTYPSLEFFYETHRGLVEIANTGIMDPLILERYGNYDRKSFYLAGGIGAERVYAIAKNINMPMSNIKQDLKL